jgi:hypothetical protein
MIHLTIKKKILSGNFSIFSRMMESQAFFGFPVTRRATKETKVGQKGTIY